MKASVSLGLLQTLAKNIGMALVPTAKAERAKKVVPMEIEPAVIVVPVTEPAQVVASPAVVDPVLEVATTGWACGLFPWEQEILVKALNPMHPSQFQGVKWGVSKRQILAVRFPQDQATRDRYQASLRRLGFEDNDPFLVKELTGNEVVLELEVVPTPAPAEADTTAGLDLEVVELETPATAAPTEAAPATTAPARAATLFLDPKVEKIIIRGFHGWDPRPEGLIAINVREGKLIAEGEDLHRFSDRMYVLKFKRTARNRWEKIIPAAIYAALES